MRNFILFIILNLVQVPISIYAQGNTIDSTQIVIRDSSNNITSDTINIQENYSDIYFNIINYSINSEEKILIESQYNPTSIKLDERDTLSMIIQLAGKEDEIIFNYYFNDNPNFRILDNGKIIYDKRSRRIYFEFVPDDNQALNRFITWNLFCTRTKLKT